MFGNMGLHVHQFPSGRYGYVGNIPTALGVEVPATTSDVMGQRAHKNARGELVAWKFRTFSTKDEAITFAQMLGFDPIVSDKD